MGIRRGPNIVRDGLVFAVDAANPSSFVSGSGVIWKDQTVNQNNGTLTNGPVFDSDGGGSIVFDGSDDYVQISSFDSNELLGQNFTVNLWIKGAVGSSGQRVAIITNQTDFNTNGWAIAINQTDYGIRRIFMHVNGTTIITDSSDPLPTPNDWNMITGIWDRINSSCFFYYNGILRVSAVGSFSSNITNDNDSLRIGSHLNNSREYTGNIGTTQIYNRALSASEVLHNYNALKGRFGL